MSRRTFGFELPRFCEQDRKYQEWPENISNIFNNDELSTSAILDHRNEARGVNHQNPKIIWKETVRNHKILMYEKDIKLQRSEMKKQKRSFSGEETFFSSWKKNTDSTICGFEAFANMCEVRDFNRPTDVSIMLFGSPCIIFVNSENLKSYKSRQL